MKLVFCFVPKKKEKKKIPGVYPVAVRKTHHLPTLKLSFLSQFSTNIVNLPKAANSDNWLITVYPCKPFLSRT